VQVDFYQLTRDPAEKVLPPITAKILDTGGRFLIVSGEDAQLARISKQLWEWTPESFLAHEMTGAADDAVQPVLLSGLVTGTNGAKMVALADGIWRDEALEFDRAFYLFEPSATDAARTAWRALGDKEGVVRKYWKQDGGKWREGP
jgi:DNA polymerase III subunit chi